MFLQTLGETKREYHLYEIKVGTEKKMYTETKTIVSLKKIHSMMTVI